MTEEGLKTPIRAKTSHGSARDLGDNLLSMMSSQIHLSKNQFLNLIDCPMSREQFEALMRQ